MREYEVRFVKRSSNGGLIFRECAWLAVDDADTALTYGSFLAKYGKMILRKLYRSREITFWIQHQESFPMKLSVKCGDDITPFNSAQRDNSMQPILTQRKIAFLLENIPSDEKSSFLNNVTTGESVIPDPGKDYSKAETDPEQVLTVKIVLESDKAKETALRDYNFDADEIFAFFSFDRKDVEGISYGIFLLKYGKDILDEFRKLKHGIPAWEEGPSFPMQLKIEEGLSYLGDRFNNFNRDQPLYWKETYEDRKTYENILSLTNIPDGSRDFSECVTKQSEAESPECMFCLGNLFDHAFAFHNGSGEDHGNIKLPAIIGGFNHADKFDIVTFPCTHKFHTHCFIHACSHNYFKCTRCTKHPGEEWLKETFQKMQPGVKTCFGNNRYALESSRQLLQWYGSKFRYGDFTTIEMPGSDESEFEKIMDHLKREVFNLEHAVNSVERELEFINSVNESPHSILRSRFQQNPNGFQRMILLLDRALISHPSS